MAFYWIKVFHFDGQLFDDRCMDSRHAIQVREQFYLVNCVFYHFTPNCMIELVEWVNLSLTPTICISQTLIV